MQTGKKSILQKGKGKERRQAKYQYLYEKQSLYFAQVSESIKALALGELRDLGAADLRPVFRGIWFTAPRKTLYRITYCARLVSRILAPLIQFECAHKDELYKAAKTVHWEEFMTPKKTFSIQANVSESKITHSNFAGLRVKDAIADYFRDRTNKRPSVDSRSPWLSVNLHIHQDMATLSVDASGGPLHKRGYREERVSAPMQETVAAAIIRRIGWDGRQPLYDPMCGSGTLLCEALMACCRIPAQVFRESFGFERLPDFDPLLWDQVRAECRDRMRPLAEGVISGSDMAETSVAASRTNIMGLHFGGQVTIGQTDFRQIPSLEGHVIVTNPPYGIRMGRGENLNPLYRDLGQFFKTRCAKSTAYVYFGEPRFIKKVPLAPAWKEDLVIGGLDGKLVKYEIH